jgi:hypothetical protein
VTKQYGSLDMHLNEESRSRYIAAVCRYHSDPLLGTTLRSRADLVNHFDRIVSLFWGVVINTPEVLLESGTSRAGRIEYQYWIIGGITVLFIEVKFHRGTIPERLNYYAQVIAEAIGKIFKPP